MVPETGVILNNQMNGKHPLKKLVKAVLACVLHVMSLVSAELPTAVLLYSSYDGHLEGSFLIQSQTSPFPMSTTNSATPPPRRITSALANDPSHP